MSENNPTKNEKTTLKITLPKRIHRKQQKMFNISKLFQFKRKPGKNASAFWSQLLILWQY